MAATRETAGRQDPEGRVVRDAHGFMSVKVIREEPKAPKPVAPVKETRSSK